MGLIFYTVFFILLIFSNIFISQPVALLMFAMGEALYETAAHKVGWFCKKTSPFLNED